MPRMEAVLPKIDLSISERLRQKIAIVDQQEKQWTHKQRYEAFEAVCQDYYTEKGVPKGVQGIQLLSALFTSVTQRTKIAKGVKVSFWGPSKFNYYLLIGHSKEVAELAWQLCDEEGVKPSSLQTSVMRHVNDVVKYKGLPARNIFMWVVTFYREHDNTGRNGLNGGWSPEVQNQIRAHYNLPPLPPPGQRKHRKQSEDHQDCEYEDVEATKLPDTPKPVEALTPKTPRKPSKGRTVTEVRLHVEIRELFNKLIDFRVAEINEEERGRVRKTTMGQLKMALDNLGHTCTRLAKARQRNAALTQEQKDLEERREYERVCRELGLSVPRNGLTNFDEFRKRFRANILPVSPDHNPGKEAEVTPRYIRLIEIQSIITNYHAKHDTNPPTHQQKAT